MGTVSVYPTSIAVQQGAPADSIVGALSEWTAIDDELTTSYIECQNATLYRTRFNFQNPSIPAGAVVQYISAYVQASTNDNTGAGAYFYPGAIQAQVVSGGQAGTTMVKTWANRPNPPNQTQTPYDFTTELSIGTITLWANCDLDTLQGSLLNQLDGSNDTIRCYTFRLDITYNEPPTAVSVEPDDLTGGETLSTIPKYVVEYDDPDGDPMSSVTILVFHEDARDSFGYAVGDAEFNPWLAIFSPGLMQAQTYTPNALYPHEGEILMDGETYYVYAQVSHAPVNGVPMISDWVWSSFVVNATPPADPSITAYPEDDRGRVRLRGLTGANNGIDVTTMRFGRYDDGEGTRRYMYEAEDVDRASAIYFPGNASNYISTVDTALWSFGTNQIRMTVKLGLAAVTGSDQTIIAKEDAFKAYISTTGAIVFKWWQGGVERTATSTLLLSSLNLDPYQPITLDFAVGNLFGSAFLVLRYSLDDGVTWTEFEASPAVGGSGSVSFDDTTTNVSVGTDLEGGAHNFLVGDLYWIEFYNYGTSALIANPTFEGMVWEDSTTFLDPASGVPWVFTSNTDMRWVGTVYDYLSPVEKDLVYFAVAGGVDANAQLVYGPEVLATPVQLDLDEVGFWVKNVDHPQHNIVLMMLPGSMDGRRSVDAGTFKPIGRPMHVEVRDVVRGFEFNPTFEVIGQEQYDQLLDLYKTARVVFIQGRFRSVFCALEDWQERWLNYQDRYGFITFRAVEVDQP